jgi:hypothetical protein
METAYGDPAASPPAEDIVEWLEWCRSIRRRPGAGHKRRRSERV